MKEYVIEYQNVVLKMKYKELVSDKNLAEEIVYTTNKMTHLTDIVAKLKGAKKREV